MPDEYYDRTLCLFPGKSYNGIANERPISYSAWPVASFTTLTAELTTTYYKDYTHSIAFSSGGSDYIAMTTSFPITEFYPVHTSTAQTFTIEAWVYQSVGTGNYPVFNFGLTTYKIVLWINRASDPTNLTLDVHAGSSTTPIDTLVAGEIARSTWTHIALQVDASLATPAIQVFIDGVYAGALDYPDFSGTVSVDDVRIGGGYPRTSSLIYSSLWMQDIRYTWGVARYSTSGFTPPGALMKTVSGVVLDSAGSPFTGTVYAIPRLGLNADMFSVINSSIASESAKSFLPGPRIFHTVANASGEFSFSLPDTEIDIVYLSKSGEASLLNDKIDRVYPG